MKLRVQHQSGRIEVLDIADPHTSQKGPRLNRIVGFDGTEYFFTKEGYYDGWGKAGEKS